MPDGVGCADDFQVPIQSKTANGMMVVVMQRPFLLYSMGVRCNEMAFLRHTLILICLLANAISPGLRRLFPASSCPEHKITTANFAPFNGKGLSD